MDKRMEQPEKPESGTTEDPSSSGANGHPRDQIESIDVRPLQTSDYQELVGAMTDAYTDMDDSPWEERHIRRLLELFPEGQFCVMVNGHAVGAALALRVNGDRLGDQHTYLDAVDRYRFGTNDPKGDVLYGIDVFIHPDYRGLRLGRRLYEARKELCERLNLRAIRAGGRMPGYAAHEKSLTPRQYIEKVRLREIHDPVLSFQLANDFHVRKVLRGYLPEDDASREYATLLEWNNIYYEASENLVNRPKRVVRLGLVQWQMRPFPDLDRISEQIEFFVDAVSGYQADFLLFPELFNAPLMADYNHLSEPEAIRQLAQFTEPLRDRFLHFALAYNVNIITGSMPYVEDGRLLNVGFLCRRDGSVERYDKLHITPSERQSWGMVGGSTLQTFETDCARIGVLICYDVEFPELGRLLADEGLDILFVPFLTDTQNGYVRVQHCAQARAIENECYVAIAGCVGNLPRVNNMDIQYAQSAVFTPSDFPFPTNGIKTEATPNTEMTLIADVDLDLLLELNKQGAVRNLQDRRLDLYSLKRVADAVASGGPPAASLPHSPEGQ